MNNSKTKQQLTFIDLFAGIGGFRLALEKFGLKCIFSSEWDVSAQKTYYNNFKEIPKGDITKIEVTDIPKHNILCGGFPCQAFSISGKQRGFEDTRGTLFFDILRIAKYHKPEVVFLENVKNFEKHDKGNTLKVVRQKLDEIGYDLYYKVLNASHYGVPTSRQRIYFVGFRKDLNIKKFEFPSPTYKQVILKDYLEPENNISSSLYIKRNDIKIKEEPIYASLIKNYPQKPVRIGTINRGGQGERIYSIYGHAITLSAYGGGIGSKTGAYLIKGRVRKLSPKECANIMGFPNSFVIPDSISQAHKQFGNSVTVPVLKLIANKILKTLYETKQD